MEKSMEKSVSSATSGNSISSKLRYPLRSSLRSKESKPPLPDFSASSIPRRRGRVTSSVSQSTTVLDLSATKKKSGGVVVDRTKPTPRRLSIQTPNGSSSSSVKSQSCITSLSESKAKRSTTPVVSSGVTRRKAEDLTSSAYWLSHIKLAESVSKHSVSLGFFKLALDAGCEPIDKVKEELKSYARRNNLDGLGDAMKELYELYNISEESKQIQNSETSSVEAEDSTIAVSLNTDNDVQSSISTPGNSKIESEITKDEEDSAVVEESAKEEEKKDVETRMSLDAINVNQEVVAPEPNVTVVQTADEKRVNKKETVPKNNKLVKAKKSLAASKTVPENKSQKKNEKITKPKNTKNQEQNKKLLKKSTAKEGEVKSLKKAENKENTVVVAGEVNNV